MIDFDISRRISGKSFSFSPENPTGARGGGATGKPWEKNHPSIPIKQGKTVTLADIDGPGCIQSFWFGGNISSSIIIRIYWDGQDAPSVEAPLPAFFGYGYPENIRDQEGNFPTLNSAMVLVAPCRGMNCYWPMPFRRHCRITLTNRSPENGGGIYFCYYCITGVYREVPDDALYFHACYRQNKPTPSDGVHTVLDGVLGRGHFAGMALSVGTNGTNDCFVEGEVKMYLDDDVYPSINYTGTEDYFCGSFAFGYDTELRKYTQYNGLYSGMYAVLGDCTTTYSYQPRFMMYRWHIPDPICFDNSIRVVIQNMHFTPSGQRPRRDDYASTAFWYQELPTAPFYALPEEWEIDFR